MPSVAIIGTRGYPSYYGGFETAVRNLVPYLSSRGWKVTVYSRETVDPSGSADSNVDVVRTPGLQTKSLSTLTYGLSSSIHAATRKPDVALIMNVANGYWLPILKARGIPTVVNVDGVEWIREKWGRVAKAVFFGGARATALFANELVMDAKAIDRYWVEEFGRGGTWIPYGGSPASEDEIGLPSFLQAGRYALAVARLVPENSIDQFLDAAEQLSTKYPVVLVGSSGYGGELEERASRMNARLPHFHHLGHVRDDKLLFGLWRNCGAYFHGHSVGGTNPALVQAMMLGAPTVARDTEFNREVLGDTGIFVEAHGEQIARSLECLLESPAQRSRLSNSARDRAREYYSWESVNRGYEDLLLRTSTTGGR